MQSLRPVRHRVRPVASVVLVAVLLAGTPAAADEPPTTTTTLRPAPTAIAPHEIPVRAEQTLREVSDIEARVAAGPPVRSVQAEVDALSDRVKALTLEDRPRTLTLLTPRDVDDLVREWRWMREELAAKAEAVEGRIRAIEAGLVRLRELTDLWRATADAARDAGLPEPVLQTIAEASKGVADAERRLTADRDALLAIAAETAPLDQRIADRLALIRSLSAQAQGEIFSIQSPPLWTALRTLPSEPLAPVLGATWRRSARLLGTRVGAGRIIARLVIFLVVLALVIAIRRRLPVWPPDDAEAFARAQGVAARPAASALLVTLVIGTVVFPTDPVILTELAMLVSLVPLALVLRDRLPGRLRTLVPVLALVFVVVLARRQFPAVSAWGRLLLAVESLTALGWIVWAFGLPRRDRPWPYGVWVTRAAYAAAAILAAALIANLAGAVPLAALLDQSVIASLFLALGLYAATDVIEALIVAGLRPWRHYRVRAVGTHLTQIRQWLLRGVRFAAGVVWLVGTLTLFGAERGAAAVLQRVLAASLAIGSLHLSVQGIAVFVLSVWLAVVVAGAVRALLEEDVLARMPLPRGVPSAISAAANYTILFVGVLLAMSAAGVALERVTLLAGAVGVGIGFGLQNVVNNFVSGLILLVERPMRIGDVVEVGPTVGTVRRIGIRSSTLRTFDGAEVIVPNGSLIAERLTNWTFSDYARRIEVRIAVADGADPETVRTLLEQAARREDVLPHPPPSALLVAVGDGRLTFVLRAWSPTYEQAPEVQSRLTAGVWAALRAANVDVR